MAPVDLSQAIIGPGMAIFSQYAAVLEADGKPMSVRTALQLINRFLEPGTDARVRCGKPCNQMIRALNQDGETAAGSPFARMPARAEPIRSLAYRLYTLCERKSWAEEARAHNELVAAWAGIGAGGRRGRVRAHRVI